MYRIAAPPYMNARPLVWALDREPEISSQYIVPSRIAQMLRARELAAGMVSVAALFTNPDLRIVPGIAIACEGPAESVKLFHRKPIEEIRTVALDTSSLSSVLLAKIILKERYGLVPDFINMPPIVPDMLASSDAAVTIGDTTMCTIRGDYAELDLGSEWLALTGLPFVFAVWAANPDLASSELVEILTRAKECGITSLEDIADAESRRLGLPLRVCRHYLMHTMQYDLTDRHMDGMLLFHRKAIEYGAVPPDIELHLYQSS